jgi:hypothetical protein
VQRLLADAQNRQELADAAVGLVRDKEQDAVMQSGKSAPRQDAIRLGDDGAKAEVQQR